MESVCWENLAVTHAPSLSLCEPISVFTAQYTKKGMELHYSLVIKIQILCTNYADPIYKTIK